MTNTKTLFNRVIAGLTGLMLSGAMTVCAAVSDKPVTPNSTEAANKLYTFLKDNYGKKTISGVQTGDMGGTTSLETNLDYKAVIDKSGKKPALIGIDFLMATGTNQTNDGSTPTPNETNSWCQSYTAAGMLLAREIWQKGGIPAFTWHWKDPSRKTDTHSSNAQFDYTKAFKAGTTEFDTESEEYQIMIKDIDFVSQYFLELQNDGVACIWRPLHEASGAWFWWGTGTGVQYVALYQMLYKRMVETNGVKNCIWVWNIERTPSIGYDQNALDPSWYPGDEYVDIIAVDVYKDADYHGSLSEYYTKITEKMGTNKIIALSENGPIPDVENMHNDGAVWSWWMPWYDSWGDTKFISQTSNDKWKSNMEDPRIITLEDMSDWGTYTGQVAITDPCQLNTATHIEAECADHNGEEVAAPNSLSGKGIAIKENNGYIKFEFDIQKDGMYDVILGGLTTYGTGKQVIVDIDGTSAKVAIDEDGPINVGSFKLKAGKQTISVVPDWTWWTIDYMEVLPTVIPDVKPSSDPNATDAVKKLYTFLKENFGKNIISGFMAGSMDGTDSTFKNHQDFNVVYTKSGKYPALGGVDFMNATGKISKEEWYQGYTKASIKIMEDLWELGGIPAFTWHWRDPSYNTDAFYDISANRDKPSDMCEFDFTKAMDANGEWNESSDIYKNMITDIDVVADYFLDLQKKGIAAIFRPLHEASGGWFWWGTKGGSNYIKLYQLIRHEMVDVKGVHNLVWVWNPQSATDSDWNPGAENYDIISVDIYNEEFDYQSNYVAYNNLKKLSNYSKIIALSENGPVVDADQCIADDAMWSWMMPWYQSWGSNFANQTSNDEWVKVMTHENVITLDEMPGWDNYSDLKIETSSNIQVYPSLVKEKLYIASDEDHVLVICDSQGRIVESDTNEAGVSSINAESWSDGIYFVSVRTANSKKVVKIMK